MARNLLMSALGLWLMTGGMVSARDLGTHGPVFPIEEPSILDAIQERLGAMERNDEFELLRQEMEETTRAYVDRPRPVTGLRKATEDRTFEVDLSITVERDLQDHEGRVFAKAGDVINPLDYSMFQKRIVLLDGDDPAQIEWALAFGNELDTLLVLTKGAPLDLTREHGRRFYFDQDGVITARFGVEALPAQIVRGDRVMRVMEVTVGEK